MREIHSYYCQLYQSYEREQVTGWDNAVKDGITHPSDMEREEVESEISYDELNEAVRSMKNKKSPGSDGFPVEFFQFFWKDLGKLIPRCINECNRDGEFSFVQKQGAITCIQNPEKDRKYIKDWRPITLLNVVYKMVSACIANRVKSVLSELIGEEQRGFLPNRYIGEHIRLI